MIWFVEAWRPDFLHQEPSREPPASTTLFELRIHCKTPLEVRLGRPFGAAPYHLTRPEFNRQMVARSPREETGLEYRKGHEENGPEASHLLYIYLLHFFC